MDDKNSSNDAISLWVPFTKEEIGLSVGLIGFVVTVLNFTNVDKGYLAAIAGVAVALLYLAGLLVYNRREAQKFEFIKNGGLSGLGYVPFFKKAQSSLLLTHADDDAPGEELNQIYRRLLSKGVAMRRLIFLRDEAPDEAYTWIASFGSHDNLQYRLVLPEHSKSMKFSFVVVDESTVIVSVPGYETLDAKEYCGRFILRHVFVLKDAEAGKVFSRMHADLWNQAIQLTDVDQMRSPREVIERVRSGNLLSGHQNTSIKSP